MERNVDSRGLLRLLLHDFPPQGSKVAYVTALIAASVLLVSVGELVSFWRHPHLHEPEFGGPDLVLQPRRRPAASSVWCRESVAGQKSCAYRNLCLNLAEKRLFLFLNESSRVRSGVAAGKGANSRSEFDDGFGFRVDTVGADVVNETHAFVPARALLLQREMPLTNGNFDAYLRAVLIPAHFSAQKLVATSESSFPSFLVVTDSYDISVEEKLVLELALNFTVFDLSRGEQVLCFAEAVPAITSTFSFPGFLTGTYDGSGVAVSGSTHLTSDNLKQFGRYFFSNLCGRKPDLCAGEICSFHAMDAVVEFTGSDLKFKNLVNLNEKEMDVFDLVCHLRNSKVVIDSGNLSLAGDIFQRRYSGFVLNNEAGYLKVGRFEPFWHDGRLKTVWNSTRTSSGTCSRDVGKFGMEFELVLKNFVDLLDRGSLWRSDVFEPWSLSGLAAYLLPTKVVEFRQIFGDSYLVIEWEEPWNVQYLNASQVGYDIVLLPENEVNVKSYNFTYTAERSFNFTGVDVSQTNIFFIYCVLDKRIKGKLRRSPQWFYVVPALFFA